MPTKTMPTARQRPRWPSWVALFSLPLAFAGCQIAGDIFKAGVWVGAILVIAVIAGVVWLVSKGV
ncbi:MAG TPA: hypothetical protein VLX11_08625 [Candidatus Acidoferrales bacterium]|nr:hypothetical protein [Candidatus Acidoferrales bacterium]